MKSSDRTDCVLLLFLAVIGCVHAQADSKPFDLGSRSQVFVDRALVREAEGVTFNLVPAKKHPTGVWLDHEKDRVLPAGPMVIYDEVEKRFKSWSATTYNTSTDGLHWEPKESNPDSWDAIRRVAVILDRNDPDAPRRYKLVTFGPGPDAAAKHPGVRLASLPETTLWYLLGYHTFISPDGRALTHLSRQPILVDPATGRSPGDMMNGCYDSRLGLYTAFLKSHSKQNKFTRRRSFAVLTSRDFVNWRDHGLVFVADQTDDAGALARINEVRPLLLTATDPKLLATHIYGVGGPIRLESCTLALLRLFTVHGKTGDGPSEIQLAVSRDLQHWERPFRQPVIPRGKVGASHEDSDWDACWFNNEGPGVEVGDEIWVYYSARNTPHDHPAGFARGSFSKEAQAEARKHVGTKYRSGIGIAVWKRDRFVSVDAPAAGGTLTTVPVTFSGNRLELNAASKAGGEIVVELLDKVGKLVARSKRCSRDDLRYRVEWESPVNLATLAGAPVSLRFHIKNAALYAFAFRK
jgi:hypothetical protein